MLLSVCGDDPVDLRYEGESDGAEAQVTKQEDTKEVLSHWCCSQTRYSCLIVVTVVGLLYVCIQHRGLVWKQGLVQVMRMSLSCLPHAGFTSLMYFSESKLSVWKNHAGGGQFLYKPEVRRWRGGPDLPW